MAYDKVVDSAQLDADLTSVANGIRSILGSTAKMGLDGMPTQLGTAVSEISTQADLMAQLSTILEGKAAGGGGDIRFITGTVTPTENEVYFNFLFDLSSVFSIDEPVDLFILFHEATETVLTTNTGGLSMLIEKIKSYTPYQWDNTKFKVTADCYFCGDFTSSTMNGITVDLDKKGGNITMDSWETCSAYNSNLLAGETYRYFAIGGVTI